MEIAALMEKLALNGSPGGHPSGVTSPILPAGPGGEGGPSVSLPASPVLVHVGQVLSVRLYLSGASGNKSVCPQSREAGISHLTNTIINSCCELSVLLRDVS